MENKDSGVRLPLIPIKSYKWFISMEYEDYPGLSDSRYWEVSLRKSQGSEPLARATVCAEFLEDVENPDPVIFLHLAEECLESLSKDLTPSGPPSPPTTIEGEYLGGQALPEIPKPPHINPPTNKPQYRWKSYLSRKLKL